MTIKFQLPWKSKTKLLLEEIDFLRAQVAQLQNYVLMVAPGAVPAYQQTPASGPTEEAGQRLFTSETEEDLEFMLQEGLISSEEYARKLEEEVDFNDF